MELGELEESAQLADVSGITRDELLRDYGSALRNHEASAFIGAGLSSGAGYVDWKGLLGEFADELHLSLDVETDFTLVAQYHINRDAGRSRERLHKKLVAEFSKYAAPTPAHRKLAELPLDVIWTTNYDALIEHSLREIGKVPRVKSRPKEFTGLGKRADCTVFKIHGDLTDPSTIVLTRDDYRDYVRKFPGFRERLRSDLSERTFLFLGFSFTDPHLDLILNELRLEFGEGGLREHYLVMRREQRDGRTSARYEYALNRQTLKIEDLLTFGIKTYLVDNFDEVPDLLKDLGTLYRRTQVFVSGAADDFAPKGKDWLEDFSYRLGQRLMTEGFNLVSGFGKGLGPLVVSGALDCLYKADVSNLDHRLRLKPFPYARARKDLFRRYRAELVSGAGFAIFIAGNKTASDSERVVFSSGVREEFELSVKAGLIPLPVGSTGSVAAEIWHAVWDDWSRYFACGTKRDFKTLNRRHATVDQVLDALIRLMRANQP